MAVDPATLSLLIIITVTSLSKVILTIAKRLKSSSCASSCSKIEVEMEEKR